MTNNAAFSAGSKYSVSYEDFGAAGDGTTDDFGAIKKAHEYANLNGLPVVTNPVKKYYIGENFSEIPVMTDVNWSASQFIIDDSKVPAENRSIAVFCVCSAMEKIRLSVKSIKKWQRKIDVELKSNALVLAVNDEKKQFIRFGLNQDSGTSQTDCFLVDMTGTILTPVIWDFENITSMEAYPVDARPLCINGGIFTTIANRAESRYTYYGRNIKINRSNVIVDGTVHHIIGELDHGAPYGGFFYVSKSSNVVFRNCHVTGHKIYVTTGSANLPVSMGSYDISVSKSIDISFINCKQDDILNTALWGCYTMNECKNVTFDGCVFSRVDAHRNITNYMIKNCVLGHQGIQAIGHGKLLVENTTVFCSRFISFRGDYGSTWDGDVEIRDCIWYPDYTDQNSPAVLDLHNSGDHDYGYVCSLPSEVSIRNFIVMDGNTVKEEYRGPCVFGGDTNTKLRNYDGTEAGGFPHIFTEKLYLKNLRTQSGRGFRIWQSMPVQCYGKKKHLVRDNEVIVPNFRAYIDDVQKFTLDYNEENNCEYGSNHRLAPCIEIRNCDDAVISKNAYPVKINYGGI